MSTGLWETADSPFIFSPVGKRRYDQKQSGYGGQTKPIFHKKARDYLAQSSWILFCMLQGALISSQPRHDAYIFVRAG